MSELQTTLVDGTYLVVKPSETLQPPVGQHRSPGILSRGEILRRRMETERKPVVAVAPVMRPTVEMDAADMTPAPKNKGGRPKKKA